MTSKSFELQYLVLILPAIYILTQLFCAYAPLFSHLLEVSISNGVLKKLKQSEQFCEQGILDKHSLLDKALLKQVVL